MITRFIVFPSWGVVIGLFSAGCGSVSFLVSVCSSSGVFIGAKVISGSFLGVRRLYGAWSSGSLACFSSGGKSCGGNVTRLRRFSMSPLPVMSQSPLMSGKLSIILTRKSNPGLFLPESMCDMAER